MRGFLSSSSSPTQFFEDLVLSGSAVPALPATPTGVAATHGAGGATVSWTDAATNETGFRIERSLAGGASFVEVGTAAANAATYLDATAAPGTTYVYRVFATNQAGDSAPSVTATTP